MREPETVLPARMSALLDLYAHWDASGQHAGIVGWLEAMLITGMITSVEKRWLSRTHQIVSVARAHAVTDSSLEGVQAARGELPESGVDMFKAATAFEATLLLKALKRSLGNKKQAAQLLRMNRTTFVETLRRHVRAGNVALAEYWAGSTADLPREYAAAKGLA